MKIRRFQYDIEYSHILTFQDYYRDKIAPYFKIDNLRYGFDNLGTIDEAIKLVFLDTNCVIHCSKGAIRIMYEGSPDDFIKGGSPQYDLFNGILNSIKEISGFGKIVRHNLHLQAVEIFETNSITNELDHSKLKESKYIKILPLTNPSQFAIVFEEGNEEIGDYSKIQFGNFSKKDIKTYDLSPFETDWNKDLFSENSGYICDVRSRKLTTTFSKSNFKILFEEIQELIKKFEK